MDEEFNAVLVETTEWIWRTREIYAISDLALQILREQTELEPSNVKYYHDRVEGDVQINWEVGSSEIKEILRYRTRETHLGREPLTKENEQTLYPRQRAVICAFRTKGFEITQVTAPGKQYPFGVDIMLYTKPGLNIQACLSIRFPGE